MKYPYTFLHYEGLLVTIVFLMAFLPRSCVINHVHPKTVIEKELVPSPPNPMIEELERVMKQSENNFER